MNNQTIDPTTDTMRLKPRRIFKCVSENKVFPRDKVRKDRELGLYYCPDCGKLLYDVTDTETGRNLMELVLI